MIILFSAGGSGSCELAGPAFSEADWQTLKQNTLAILRRRGEHKAASLFAQYPFTIKVGMNDFNDDFCVLQATVPLDKYEAATQQSKSPEDKLAFRRVAEVVSEIGTYIRFIGVDLAMTMASPDEVIAPGLTELQVKKLVNRYIGVEGGYLGDFSYRSHADFYTDLDLNIDPYRYQGTTRERFMQIVSESAPAVQVTILRGILKRFPPESSQQRLQLSPELEHWIRLLETGQGVGQPQPVNASTTVKRALKDAEHLLQTTGATSAVDRVHTALHGYELDLCKQIGIPLPPDATLTQALKALRKEHPAFQIASHRSQDISTVLNSLASVLDALNPIRNKASVAHPNEVLLDEVEAQLVINAARSIFLCLDSKVNAWRAAKGQGAQSKTASIHASNLGLDLVQRSV